MKTQFPTRCAVSPASPSMSLGVTPKSPLYPQITIASGKLFLTNPEWVLRLSKGPGATSENFWGREMLRGREGFSPLPMSSGLNSHPDNDQGDPAGVLCHCGPPRAVTGFQCFSLLTPRCFKILVEGQMQNHRAEKGPQDTLSYPPHCSLFFCCQRLS